MRDYKEPPSVELNGLKIVVRALQSITFDEFAAVLAECGHDQGYAKSCWRSFHRDPFAYIISRNPICQGNALLEFLYERCRKLDREQNQEQGT